MDVVESLVQEVLVKIKGSYIINRSVTTSSVYIKMPDGFSMRVSDHKGRQKYKYRWNVGPQYDWARKWILDGRCMRYYTDRVDDVVEEIAKSYKKERRYV